jgi:hypothetical protein
LDHSAQRSVRPTKATKPDAVTTPTPRIWGELGALGCGQQRRHPRLETLGLGVDAVQDTEQPSWGGGFAGGRGRVGWQRAGRPST